MYPVSIVTGSREISRGIDAGWDIQDDEPPRFISSRPHTGTRPVMVEQLDVHLLEWLSRLCIVNHPPDHPGCCLRQSWSRKEDTQEEDAQEEGEGQRPLQMSGNRTVEPARSGAHGISFAVLRSLSFTPGVLMG